jgi:predicted CopG family antitoxin
MLCRRRNTIQHKDWSYIKAGLATDITAAAPTQHAMAETECITYKRCTILLRVDVYQQLSQEGRFKESFSDLISRLLSELDLKRGSIENKETKMLKGGSDLAIHPPAASSEVHQVMSF